MTKMWKVVYGAPAPVEVMAEIPNWPNRDESGAQIFENTHFTDEAEAWDKHLAEHQAGVSLSTRRLEHQRRETDRLTVEAADAAIFLVAVWDAKRKWEESR